MRFKHSYYFKTAVAAAVAAAAGLVLGLMIEATHAITRSSDGAYFVTQSESNDAFVLCAMPSALVA